MFVIAASLLLPLHGYVRNPTVLLALGPFVAFFGTGYYSGFGPMTAEIYPTAIRATAQGFTYNTGVAFTVAGAAFLLAAVALIWVPDTHSDELS